MNLIINPTPINMTLFPAVGVSLTFVAQSPFSFTSVPVLTQTTPNASMIGAVLAGLTTSTGGIISTNDSIVYAFGKIQKQISDLGIANTGDETLTTIKTKLGITTLSGSNTGDQDLSTLATNSTLTAGLLPKENLSNKVTTFTTIDDTTYPTTRAVAKTYKYSETITISNSKGSTYTVASNVDVMPTLQTIFNGLNTARTSKVKIEMEGTFLISSKSIVPSEGLIWIDGSKASMSIDNNWSPTNTDLNGASFIGCFQIGTTANLVPDVEISGFTATGTCFQSATGTVTDLANIYYGTTTGTSLIWNTSTGTIPSGTNGNKPKIAFIHSLSVMQNCFFHDMKIRNMGTPITFEGMAKISGTPSDNVLIYNIRQEKIWVGCQYYGNGYKFQNCHIFNISTNRCYDDCVAICGGSGGISGTSYGFALIENCNVWNIRGFKGGLTGSGAKLDPGSQFLSGVNAGNGVAVNCTYDNINMSTDGSGEHLVAFFKGQNQTSKDHVFDHLQGLGTWSSLGFFQIFGRGLEILTVSGESSNGIILQASSNPNTRQSIKIGNWNVSPTQTTLGDNRRGNGLTICAGGAGQGFMNIVSVGKITTYNIAVPINETTPPTGFGVASTNQNVYYNIDITYQNVTAVAYTDCLFSSTNRIVELSYFGQYQGRYGDLNLLSGNLNLSAGNVTGSGTITGSNLTGINTGDQTTITGNAGTATILQTSRNINGVLFNGSADITIADTTKLLKNGDTITGDIANTSTGYLQRPVGTTVQRPAMPFNGMSRYNTTTTRDEFYAAGSWQNHSRLSGDVFTGAISATNLNGTNTGDQDLSGLVVKANNLSDLTNIVTARTNLGLVIGTNVQAYNASTTTLGNTTTGSGSIVLATAPTFTDPIITVASQPVQQLLYSTQKDLASNYVFAAGTSEEVITGLTVTLPIINKVCTIKITTIVYAVTVAGNQDFATKIGTSTSFTTNTLVNDQYVAGAGTYPTFVGISLVKTVNLATQNYISLSYYNTTNKSGAFISASGHRSNILVEIYA